MAFLHLKSHLRLNPAPLSATLTLHGKQFIFKYSSTFRDTFNTQKKLEDSLKQDDFKLRNISYITSKNSLQPSKKSNKFKGYEDVYCRIKLLEQRRSLKLMSCAQNVPSDSDKQKPIDSHKQSEKSSDEPCPERKPINKILIGLFCALVTSGLLYILYFRSSSDKETGEKQKVKSTSKQKIPPTSAEIPNEVPYLLIGGGTASFAAFRAIKTADPVAKILVLSNEPYYPYMRPPLSKEMFYSEDRVQTDDLKFKQWNGTVRSIFYEPDEFYIPCNNLLHSENGGIAVAQGWSVKHLDPTKKMAVLDDGKEINYKKCLLATGSRPKVPPAFKNITGRLKNKINFYRNIDDFQKLDHLVSKGNCSVVIVGNGFLGSELACAIAKKGRSNNVSVTQVFTEDFVMSKVLPKYLCSWTTEKIVKEGVEVKSSSKIEEVKDGYGKAKILLASGEELEADQIIVASGAEAVTDLAESARLEVDEYLGGFMVNSELSARSDIYAAGDCACFYDVDLGRRRVEHHDHAVISGRLAGENMTGAEKAYIHQPMFWSDIGPEIGFEAIGIIDSSLPTVGVYTKKESEESLEIQDDPSSPKETNKEDAQEKHQEEYEKGVIFYLKNDIVVGIVLWNLFNKMDIARLIIKEKKKFEDLNEVAKLFNIYGIKDTETSEEKDSAP